MWNRCSKLPKNSIFQLINPIRPTVFLGQKEVTHRNNILSFYIKYKHKVINTSVTLKGVNVALSGIKKDIILKIYIFIK